MISIILYGRNDSYGYNLHKRAALSLNCMAEVLTAENDEIIFVDYNTPDDYPTFPEAIYDTLTEKAKRTLRIIRIRSSLHKKLYSDRTHLKALEPISRNAAVRRSNPKNRWILSTNTDMIFVPKFGYSLTDTVATLKDGFYCAPRYEVPETLWEGFNRLDPIGVIGEVERLGIEMHLNEIVLGADTIPYDAPGDFQLILRDDLFKIFGFDEGMLLGWHVDSNISKRLSLLYGSVGDASAIVSGYHCDHTRQITPMHAAKSVENSLYKFVDSINQPEIESQRESWGLEGYELEEISLSKNINERYINAIISVISSPLSQPLKVLYRSDSFDEGTVTPEHVLPFIVDLFSNAPPGTLVLWVGPVDIVSKLFKTAVDRLGIDVRVEAFDPENTDLIYKADAYIFNFGCEALISGEVERDVIACFGRALVADWGSDKDRRFVGINAINNRFEYIFSYFVGCGRTPYSSRLRHGYLLKDSIIRLDRWLNDIIPGVAGRMENGSIKSTDKDGYICYGPYKYLVPGKYRATVDIFNFTRFVRNAELNIDVVLSTRAIAELKLDLSYKSNNFSLEFEIEPSQWRGPIEIRVHKKGNISVRIDEIMIERLN